MEFKVLAILFLVAATANALTVHKTPGITGRLSPRVTPCNKDYGALFGRLLCPILAGVPKGLNHTMSIGDINIEDLHLVDPGLVGFINLTNIELVGADGIVIAPCSMATLTDTAPLSAHVEIDIPEVVLNANYKLDATFFALVPIWGEGVLNVALSLKLVVDTDIAFCPLENPMAMETVDYVLTLSKNIDINMTGLLDGAAFVEEIIKKIEEPSSFYALEKAVHNNITALIPGVADPLLANFTPCQFLGC